MNKQSSLRGTKCRSNLAFKLISFLVVVAFTLTTVFPPSFAGELSLRTPNSQLQTHISPASRFETNGDTSRFGTRTVPGLSLTPLWIKAIAAGLVALVLAGCPGNTQTPQQQAQQQGSSPQQSTISAEDQKIIQEIMATAKDKKNDEETRLSAINRVIQGRNTALINDFADIFIDETNPKELRTSAIVALIFVGKPAAPTLKKLLDRINAIDDAEFKDFVARAIEAMDDPSRLIALVRDKKADVDERRKAIGTLFRINEVSIVPDLIGIFLDTSETTEVRTTAAYGLTWLYDPKSTPPSPKLIGTLFKELVDTKNDEEGIVTPVTILLGGLGKLDKQIARDLLAAYDKHKDSLVIRRRIIKALGYVQDPSTVPFLIDIAFRPISEGGLERAAFDALLMVGHIAVPALSEVLFDDTKTTVDHKTTIFFLGRTNHPSAASALLRFIMQHDESSKLVLHAYAALFSMKYVDIASLIAAQDEALRRKVLNLMLPSDPAALNNLPSILQTLQALSENDPSPAIKEAAKQLLEKIKAAQQEKEGSMAPVKSNGRFALTPFKLMPASLLGLLIFPSYAYGLDTIGIAVYARSLLSYAAEYWFVTLGIIGGLVITWRLIKGYVILKPLSEIMRALKQARGVREQLKLLSRLEELLKENSGIFVYLRNHPFKAANLLHPLVELLDSKTDPQVREKALIVSTEIATYVVISSDKRLIRGIRLAFKDGAVTGINRIKVADMLRQIANDPKMTPQGKTTILDAISTSPSKAPVVKPAVAATALNQTEPLSIQEVIGSQGLITTIDGVKFPPVTNLDVLVAAKDYCIKHLSPITERQRAALIIADKEIVKTDKNYTKIGDFIFIFGAGAVFAGIGWYALHYMTEPAGVFRGLRSLWPFAVWFSLVIGTGAMISSICFLISSRVITPILRSNKKGNLRSSLADLPRKCLSYHSLSTINEKEKFLKNLIDIAYRHAPEIEIRGSSKLEPILTLLKGDLKQKERKKLSTEDPSVQSLMLALLGIMAMDPTANFEQFDTLDLLQTPRREFTHGKDKLKHRSAFVLLALSLHDSDKIYSMVKPLRPELMPEEFLASLIEDTSQILADKEELLEVRSAAALALARMAERCKPTHRIKQAFQKTLRPIQGIWIENMLTRDDRLVNIMLYAFFAVKELASKDTLARPVVAEAAVPAVVVPTHATTHQGAVSITEQAKPLAPRVVPAVIPLPVSKKLIDPARRSS